MGLAVKGKSLPIFESPSFTKPSAELVGGEEEEEAGKGEGGRMHLEDEDVSVPHGPPARLPLKRTR